jgi:addiction module RelE/StbE family toxin
VTVRHQVLWTAVAVRDLERIVSTIAEETPQNAKKVLSKLQACASALVKFPARGRVVPELKWFGVDRYRELQVPPWRIVYRVEAKQVFVVAVLDGRRHLEDLLLHRFLDS